jgi:hypothetical protein
MASDAGSDRATGGMWATGQHADAVTSRPAAMSAPGSESYPGWSRVSDPPDAPDVEMTSVDGRHLLHGRDGS